MLNTITTGISTAINAVGSVISAIFTTGDSPGSWSVVLPVIGLAIGFFVCRVGIRIIKSLIQGY